MSKAVSELTEDELFEAVAAAMSDLGLMASAQDTGGGTLCVVLEHKDGGEISWGTAEALLGPSVKNGAVLSKK